MPVQISEFFPVVVPLFKKPDNPEDRYDCIDGMEDVWVRIVPPTWEADRQRQAFINSERENLAYSFLDVYQFEIYLTYGGTNMAVEVPKHNDQGQVIWKKDSEYGCETEVVKFEESGKLTLEEFSVRIAKLPLSIIEYWHARVLEVAKQWGRFRR